MRLAENARATFVLSAGWANEAAVIRAISPTDEASWVLESSKDWRPSVLVLLSRSGVKKRSGIAL